MIPMPKTGSYFGGGFRLTPDMQVAADPALESVGLHIQHQLLSESAVARRPAVGIRLRHHENLPPEGYRLTVDERGVCIDASETAGAYYGYQTLLQLLPVATYRWLGGPSPQSTRVSGWAVPHCEITDAPKYAWRGAMLDVARHFLPVREVLRFVDLMSLHKLNVLHLHLTDDQGWRIEIKRYPRLTEVGSWRVESQVGSSEPARLDGRPHGGFYTQDDLRQIVAYASVRHVTVVPEVDAPGHMQAAIAAYPSLGASAQEQIPVGTTWGISDHVLNVEEATLTFLRNVFDEVIDIFPSRFIAIGGDECPKTQWRNDPVTRETMRRLNIPDEDRLQSWLVAQVAKHVADRGRQAIGWDEIIEGGLPDEAAVMSWRGMTGARLAAALGRDVVASPYDQTYLDHRQSESSTEPIPSGIVLDLEAAYAFDPIPRDLEPELRMHILGGQANLWTEHVDTSRMIDYYAFPRLCAIAETLWSVQKRSFDHFYARLLEHLGRLDAMGVEYRPVNGPHPWQQRPGVNGRQMTREECEMILADLVSNISA